MSDGPSTPRKRVPLGEQASAVRRFLTGKATLEQLATEHGVSLKTVREWVRVYKNGTVMRDLSSGEAVEKPAAKTPKTEPPATGAPKKEPPPESGERKKFTFF